MQGHLSLIELNKLIQATLSSNLESGYWVLAEISELKVNQNGHCYIELVEKDDYRVIAKTKATIWANVYNNLSLWFEKMTGQIIKPGIKILCFGSIQYHELYGLSFNIKDIDANFTLGERERKRQEVIQQLQSDGVFDLNKEQYLDAAFQKIAIISSPVAAGYEDFINQLESNPYGYQYDLSLFKATMQGEAAAESIINSLHQIHNSSKIFEAVIIIRGGGSRVDLDCFDNYELAFHACQMNIPVITGIGHERDESILDMVAYKALKTPTAVAEWIISRSMDVEATLIDQLNRISKLSSLILREKENILESINNRLMNSQKMIVNNQRHKLESIISRLRSAAKYAVQRQISDLENTGDKVNYLDPFIILKRGYSITSINGRIIKDQKVKIDDIIETRTLYSNLKSKIVNIEDLNEEK